MPHTSSHPPRKLPRHWGMTGILPPGKSFRRGPRGCGRGLVKTIPDIRHY